jgi:ABC-type antimicrobial peptide transport system permease subunit
MARRLWPGQDALGKIIAGACGGDRRVVGIVGDVRHLALEEGAGNEMYLPIRQCQDWSSVDLVVRTTGAPEEIGGGVRDALKQVAPNISPKEFRSLERLVDKSVSPRRFVVTLAGGFAVFALILASLGIYALISYSVTQRTQEIGIRMALGAEQGDMRRMIMRQGLVFALIGVVLGIAGAFALAKQIASFLFGVTVWDPWVFGTVPVVLMAASVLAVWLPSIRATRVDPATALRQS